MNTLQFTSVMSALDEAGVAMEDRAFVLMVTVARASAYAAPIPAEPQEDSRAFFFETIRPNVESELARINERLVLDIDQALGICEAIWRARYMLVHVSDSPPVREFLDAIVRAGSRHIPAELSDAMIKLPQANLLDRVANQLYPSNAA